MSHRNIQLVSFVTGPRVLTALSCAGRLEERGGISDQTRTIRRRAVDGGLGNSPEPGAARSDKIVGGRDRVQRLAPEIVTVVE